MHRGVFTVENDPDLRVYVVWVPMVRGLERNVPRATTAVPDDRARHYWDGESLLVRGYRDTLKLSEDAWDIFLLYGPDTRWEGDLPPAPYYWMHQLGPREKPRVHGPYLDPPTFLQRTRELLGAL